MRVSLTANVVIGEPALALAGPIRPAVTTTSSVASGRLTSPGQAPSTRRVRAERVLHHQALVADALESRRDSVEVLRISRLSSRASRYGGFRPSPSRCLRRVLKASSRRGPASSHKQVETTNTPALRASAACRPACARVSAAARRSGARAIPMGPKNLARPNSTCDVTATFSTSSGNAPSSL